MEPVGDLNRTIPWVKSVNYIDINSTRRKVSFTILDETAEDIEYTITPVSGSFSPNKGTLTFPPKSMVLDSNYSNLLGGLPIGNIELKNPRGDTFIYNFTGSNSQLVLNTPPNINNIKMVVDKREVTVTANVDDLENDGIRKKWRLVKGKPSEVAGTNTSDDYILEDYNNSTELCVELNATDDRGASSVVRYCLLNSSGVLTRKDPHTHANCLGYVEKSGKDLNNNGILDDNEITKTTPYYAEGTPITRKQLDTMISNGDDVTGVNTCEIEDMSYLFQVNLAFNQDIGRWNVGSVTDMHEMFYGATSFNQDIGKWDVSKVTSMWGMFEKTDDFNQDISD